MIWVFLFYLLILYLLFKLYLREDEGSVEENRMIVMLKCKKCGWTKESIFAKGDYLFKTVNDERTKHNCDGEVEIVGIYLERRESEKERRWKEYVKKFR